jgi:hypothetical protein
MSPCLYSKYIISASWPFPPHFATLGDCLVCWAKHVYALELQRKQSLYIILQISYRHQSLLLHPILKKVNFQVHHNKLFIVSEYFIIIPTSFPVFKVKSLLWFASKIMNLFPYFNCTFCSLTLYNTVKSLCVPTVVASKTLHFVECSCLMGLWKTKNQLFPPNWINLLFFVTKICFVYYHIYPCKMFFEFTIWEKLGATKQLYRMLRHIQ